MAYLTAAAAAASNAADDRLLDDVIKLCLGDSQFPAFVARVDQRLKGVLSDSA